MRSAAWSKRRLRTTRRIREITRVEWKTRGHDHAPGLHQCLLDHGFVAEEPESIMIGEAQRLAVDLPLPDDVTLRQVSREERCPRDA